MGESSDPRLDFIQDFTLKSLRLKPDKWARMVVSDEQVKNGPFYICKKINICIINETQLIQPWWFGGRVVD